MIPGRWKASLIALVVSAAVACSADITTGTAVPPQPTPTVLLKEINVGNLPSPFYQFSYDAAGRVVTASFAGLRFYEVSYDGNRIAQLANNGPGNHDRVVYLYDEAGRVASVGYVDSSGVTIGHVFFTYDRQQLASLVRDTRAAVGFVVDKEMSFTYDDNGNLLELDQHRPAISDGQEEVTQIFRFEDYDNRINADAFTLIHNDFFDHLVLLPGVQLQKGNARHLTIATRADDGPFLTLDVIYTYAYDGVGRPVAKSGDVTILNGPNAGERSQISSFFSYY